MTFRNPPENYFFMTWNWPLIRKLSLWLFLSALVAMLALVIAMIVSLPKKCNPPTQWYQGNVIYEIFPPSFADADGDGIGDLKGLSAKADYILALGAKAVRLNSIFSANEYPENYQNVTSLTEIAKPLGTLKEFGILHKSLRARNISLILDLPLYPFIKKLSPSRISGNSGNNDTENKPIAEFLKLNVDHKDDPISQAIVFWQHHGVEGFYLKDLEYYVNDTNFVSSLRRWKQLLGQDGVLIVSNAAFKAIPNKIINIFLNNVDLIDIQLSMEGGVDYVSKEIDNVLNSTLFSKAGMPWVHWSLGDVNSVRLANRLHFGNATLGATMLQLMLPGTPSIFYGDEIGLHQISDEHNEKEDVKHLHQLGAMIWKDPQKQFSHKATIPWMHGQPQPANFDQLELISKLIAFRAESPSIYINVVNKEGETKANAEVKYSKRDMLVIQRWYPRRKAYVVVCNLGDKFISEDLSNLLYSGQIVVGPRGNSRSEMVSFKDVSLWPGESVVILLD